jgi:hypothetical protein
MKLQDTVMTFKNGKPVEKFYTGQIRKARKDCNTSRGWLEDTCFLHYRDEGRCLAQDNNLCRICKQATFIVLRQLQDARIEERLRTLKEFVRLSENQIKELKENRQ